MSKHDKPARPDRVSSLELFFDLVFVFVITQISSLLVRSPGAHGLWRSALILGVILWMYGGYAYLTNSATAEHWGRKLLLFTGMGAFFICALSVPRAFSEDAVAFGAAYLVINLVHLTGYILAPGDTPRATLYRIVPWNLTSSGLVLAAGLVPAQRDLLFTLALVVQILTPILAHAERGFVLNAAHFAERHGLVILIVLGESLVSIGAAVEKHQRVDGSLVFGAASGLLLAGAMWWCYFEGEDTRAARAFEHAPSVQARARQAITGYGLAHAFMIYGVVAVAAGTRLAVGSLSTRASVEGAWLIAGGSAAYLVGLAGFRWSLGFATPWPRALGALLCLTCVPVGLHLSTASELLVLGLVLGCTAAFERRS